MTNETFQLASGADVAGWLNSIERTSAAPVLVRIGRETYPGAIYSQERHWAPYSWRAGEGPYMQTALYLVGDLPASFKRSRKVAYRFEHGRRRWFVGSWADERAAEDERTSAYHPFGRAFQMFPDEHGVTVDDDGRPYDERTIRLERC